MTTPVSIDDAGPAALPGLLCTEIPIKTSLG
jgi:hypothetical protein